VQSHGTEQEEQKGKCIASAKGLRWRLSASETGFPCVRFHPGVEESCSLRVDPLLPYFHAFTQGARMWSFLTDLARNMGTERIVVLMDPEEAGRTHRFRIRPARIVGVWGGSLLLAGTIGVLVIVFTPLRTQIPGYGTEQIQESAQLNALRLRSLQDSLKAQRRYVRRLRRLITGRVDSVARPNPRGTDRPSGEASSRRDPGTSRSAADADPGVHEQPALTPSVGLDRATRKASLLGLSFPLPPPVTNGFPTRGFNAETGHYGIDVAVSEGEYIRAVGDGYVVGADWTQDGGYTIAVQHADGYLSVYKHNKRLLKRIGDRVRAQEPLAISGNTGNITTGPHLHFELWRHGLAQGPEAYVAGW